MLFFGDFDCLVLAERTFFDRQVGINHFLHAPLDFREELHVQRCFRLADFTIQVAAKTMLNLHPCGFTHDITHCLYQYEGNAPMVHAHTLAVTQVIKRDSVPVLNLAAKFLQIIALFCQQNR